MQKFFTEPEAATFIEGSNSFLRKCRQSGDIKPIGRTTRFYLYDETTLRDFKARLNLPLKPFKSALSAVSA